MKKLTVSNEEKDKDFILSEVYEYDIKKRKKGRKN